MIMELFAFSKENGRMKGNIKSFKNNDDLDQNLLHLFKAILNVDNQFVYRGDIHSQRLERVFAYELYHQWSIIIDKMNHKIPNDDKHYIINAETGKDMEKFVKNPCKATCYPDMILHKSIDKPDGQALVCEIKRNDRLTKGGLKNDIEKLKTFACESQNKYCFHFGVFLLVGGNLDSIFEKMNILSWTTRSRKIGYKNIWIIAYEEHILQCVSLYDALDKKERTKYLERSNR